MKLSNHFFPRRTPAGWLGLGLAAAVLGLPARLAAQGEQHFDGPEAALAALTHAAIARDTNAIHA